MATEIHGFPYVPKVVADLPDLKEAVAAFEASNVNVPHFGRIILNAGLQDVVGLTVMHRHYGVKEDEVILETIEGSKGNNLRFLCQATKYADVEERMVPYIIRFDKELNQWIGVEWTVASAGDAAVFFDRLVAEQEFLTRMAEELTSRSLESSVGLTLVHRVLLTDAEQEVLCETTDRETGVSVTVPLTKAEVAALGQAAVPAHYKFTMPDGFSKGDELSDEAITTGMCVWCCNEC